MTAKFWRGILLLSMRILSPQLLAMGCDSMHVVVRKILFPIYFAL